MVEIWKDIEECPRYEVSNTGKVRNKKTMRILKAGVQKNGYNVVVLSNGSRIFVRRVHRLVAEAFIPNPDNLAEVNHIDENKLNNCVENLQWISHRDNVNYGTHFERMVETKKRSGFIKPVLQYARNGKLIRRWDSAKEAAAALNLYAGNICSCCKGKLITTGGFIWKYENPEFSE